MERIMGNKKHGKQKGVNSMHLRIEIIDLLTLIKAQLGLFN